MANIITGTSNNDTLTGTLNDDFISGGSGNDVINALGGDDILDGGVGNDSLSGGDGNDTLQPGLGDDTVDGGTGTDSITVDYTNASFSYLGYDNLGISNDSSGIYGSYYAKYYGIQRLLRYSNIEQFNITGTAQNDNLTSLVGQYILKGGAGNDTLSGKAGDSIYGETGNDSVTGQMGSFLDGGEGTDTLNLDLATTTINWALNLSLTNNQLSGDSNTQVKNFENIGTITTGSGSDSFTLTGAALVNNGSVNGGTGTDSLTVDYTNASFSYIGYDNLGISNDSSGIYGSYYAKYYGIQRLLRYSNIEQFNITGTAQNDNLTSLVGQYTLNGGGGNDTLSGKTGDYLDGGTGTDLLNLDLGSTTTNWSLNWGLANNQLSGDSNTQVKNFENIGTITTGSGSDSFTLTGAALVSNGSVNGGTGTDSITVDYTNASFTYLGYENLGISNDSSGIYGSYYGKYYGTGQKLLRYSNIEQFNITGTSQNDNLTSLVGQYILNGGGGNDTLSGKTGDYLDGGTGTDLLNLDLGSTTTNWSLNWGLANNQLSGDSNTQVKNFESIGTITTGSGSDSFTLTGAALVSNGSVNGGTGTDSITVDYTNASFTYLGYENLGISNDSSGIYGSYYGKYYGTGQKLLRYSNIEQFNITGTSQNDNLTSLVGQYILNGGGGNDTLSGKTGDYLDGGTGTDLLNLDLGSTTTNWSLNWGLANNQLSGDSNTQVKNFESIGTITTGSGNDSFTLTGAALVSNGSVNGGTGTDSITVDYTNASFTYLGYENLGISNDSSGIYGSYYGKYYGTGQKLLRYSNIEQFNITGTSSNDNLTGFDNADTIIGGTGNDTLKGGAGNDVIIGVNPYTATPGLNEIDIIDGGAGSDTIILGNNTQYFYDDNSTTSSGTGNYARIQNFNKTEDFIQLYGSKTNYRLAASPINGITGTAIYRVKTLPEPDELIAIIEGVAVADLNLNSSYFVQTIDEIAFSAANFRTGEDGTTNAVVTLTRTLGNRGQVNVTLNLNDGTATAGLDYNNTPIQAVFAEGESQKTVLIPITDDTLYEGNETINLSFTITSSPSGTTTGTIGTATLTIVEEPVINFSVVNYTVDEGGTIQVTVNRTGSTDGEVGATLSLSDGTATSPGDYDNTPINITFAPGETTKNITLTIPDDFLESEFEFLETVNLSLSNPTGNATIGTQNTATLVISPNLTLNGVAKLTTGVNGISPVLRLTDNLSQSGGAFVTNPISLADDVSFSTFFEFQISNPQGVSDLDGQGADGLVFVIQTIANNVGGGGGGIGYEGINKSLGIEFDTFNNGGIDDNSGNHVGINLNGNIDSVALQPIPTRLNNGNVWRAWVDYNGSTNILEVRLAQTNQRPVDPLLTYSVDLLTVLGQKNAFIGFTSGTGAASGIHDILDWKFNTSYNPIGSGILAFSNSEFSVNEDGSAIVAVRGCL
ncbi:Calx-beta domain-containing protein [Gloeothece verrucosa]|uniref:Legume lectin beta domain protein n=1 Tax=Gloeothece verrucosa (strain PCC 7822) TaxID=497965 RepID=E0UN70_GLOV7|nr:Calx-beta domain-containing protein [Gloeothece verrucosa]ADN18400.1 legume lectin beta domain protein [Gloeothece verrucosa PCC 7822]